MIYYIIFSYIVMIGYLSRRAPKGVPNERFAVCVVWLLSPILFPLAVGEFLYK